MTMTVYDLLLMTKETVVFANGPYKGQEYSFNDLADIDDKVLRQKVVSFYVGDYGGLEVVADTDMVYVAMADDIPLAVFGSIDKLREAVAAAEQITDYYNAPITKNIMDALEEIGLGGLVALSGWNEYEYRTRNFEYIAKEVL